MLFALWWEVKSFVHQFSFFYWYDVESFAWFWYYLTFLLFMWGNRNWKTSRIWLQYCICHIVGTRKIRENFDHSRICIQLMESRYILYILMSDGASVADLMFRCDYPAILHDPLSSGKSHSSVVDHTEAAELCSDLNIAEPPLRSPSWQTSELDQKSIASKWWLNRVIWYQSPSNCFLLWLYIQHYPQALHSWANLGGNQHEGRTLLPGQNKQRQSWSWKELPGIWCIRSLNSYFHRLLRLQTHCGTSFQSTLRSRRWGQGRWKRGTLQQISCSPSL